MRCECCICNILYDVKEPFEDDSVSTGMCPECAPIILGNLERDLSRPESSHHSSGDCCPNLNPRIRPSDPMEDPSERMSMDAESVPNRTIGRGVCDSRSIGSLND
jgi:hypothetical protein